MKISIKDAVIFCGGRGTRLNITRSKKILKPLVKINGKPLLNYIIDIYKKNNIDKIYILGGYKFKELLSSVSLSEYSNVKIINTGLNTGTAGRLLKIKKLLENKFFYLTYGDTFAKYNPKLSLKYVNENPKHLVMSSYKYPLPYGVIDEKKGIIKKIYEKNFYTRINAGFYTLNSSIFKYIKGYGESFEIDTLPKLIKDNYKIKEIQLKNWYPVDNEYDKKIIESFLKKNKK